MLSSLKRIITSKTDESSLKELIAPKEVVKDHIYREKYEEQEEQKEQDKREEIKEQKNTKQDVLSIKRTSNMISKKSSLKSRKTRKTKKSKRKYNLTKPRQPIVYKKYPKLNDLLRYLEVYTPGKNEIGDIVKFKNNMIVQIAEYRNRPVPVMFKLNPSDIEYFLKLNKHQRYQNAIWPKRSDPKFKEKIHQLLLTFGFAPDRASDFFDPKACANIGKDIKLKYYQKIVSTYLVYGPYRGIISWHSLGSGKTCASIDAIDKYIQIKKLVKGLSLELNNQKDIRMNKYKIFVVLPPKKSIEENFRQELIKCPSLVKEAIIESKNRKNLKTDLTNHIINKNLTIISYVSLANRIRKGKINLDNSLVIFDEAHQFLYPAPQFASHYNYLEEKVTQAENIKISLLTATPIFHSISDLCRLINILKYHHDRPLPTTELGIKRKYFNNNKLNKTALTNDIIGYISYNNTDNNVSLFARKSIPQKHYATITQDHYERWFETHQKELSNYGLNTDETLSGEELISIKDKKFLNQTTGYLKRSSAQANYPSRSYKSKGIWPNKFKVLLEQIEKYPNEKHFIISRHKESGANAVGYYLEKKGWTRLSNNRYDHGSNPPKTNNKIGENLFKLQSSYLKNEITESNYNKEREEIIKQMGPKRKFYGFSVLNGDSSQREIKYVRNMFNGEPNQTELNVKGDLHRVFIVDEKFAEGISLYNTLHIHLLEPPYNYQTEEQAIGRIVRLCGHKGIQPSKRIISIHKYYAKYNNKSMTNNELQDYNDMNQVLLSQVQNVAINAAIETGLSDAKLDKDATRDLFVFKRLSNAVGKLN